MLFVSFGTVSFFPGVGVGVGVGSGAGSGSGSGSGSGVGVGSGSGFGSVTVTVLDENDVIVEPSLCSVTEPESSTFKVPALVGVYVPVKFIDLLDS